MRKRINRGAVCSSENYRASKAAHLSMLKENHEHFCGMMITGEIKLDVPKVATTGIIEPKFKTITIFGKEMQITIEEYRTHYLKAKL
jgi:hypothetical protein